VSEKKQYPYRGFLLPFYTAGPKARSQWATPGVIYEPLAGFRRLLRSNLTGDPRRWSSRIFADLINVSSALAGGGAGRATFARRGGEAAVIRRQIAKKLDAPPSTRYIGGRYKQKQRPFNDDYKSGAEGAAVQRLSRTIEGVDMRAAFVAGRRSVNGEDIGLGGEDVRAIATLLAGQEPIPTLVKDLPRNTSGTYRHGSAGATREIRYKASLSEGAADETIGHELGHMIDEVAGQIETKGAVKEFDRVWGELYSGQFYRKGRGLPKPIKAGYSKEEAPREAVAETIRAYMQDPNYVKSVAPKAAQKIRAAVNSHEEISKIIQFNAGGHASLAARAMSAARRGGSDGAAKKSPQRAKPVEYGPRRVWIKPYVRNGVKVHGYWRLLS